MSQNPKNAVALETIAGESEKFTASLLFVHGLWGRAAVWRRFMGYCAHRGWTCHALNLPGRGAREARPGGLEAGLLDPAPVITAAAAVGDRPVLIGHDLGGLRVLASGAEVARAIVALAPLSPTSIDAVVKRLLSGWRAKLAFWQSRPVTPTPGSRRDDYLHGADELGLVVPESPHLLRALGAEARVLKLGGAVPTLIVAGELDRFAPPEQLRQLAMQLGADFALVEGAGHALPWDKGWEKTVAVVHRWLVQTLGEDLLIVREEEE